MLLEDSECKRFVWRSKPSTLEIPTTNSHCWFTLRAFSPRFPQHKFAFLANFVLAR